MRGLLERILLSRPKHENTGLESVSIIQILLQITNDRAQATAKSKELGTPNHSEIKKSLELQTTAKLKELGTPSHSEIGVPTELKD